MPNKYKSKIDQTRLALLEKATEDQENDIKELFQAIRGLTEELTKTREAMIRKFSFMAGVAAAFGAIGGLIGTGFALLIEFIAKKG